MPTTASPTHTRATHRELADRGCSVASALSELVDVRRLLVDEAAATAATTPAARH